MKRKIILPSLLAAFSTFAATADLTVPSSSISMVEGMIDINIDFDLKSIPVKSNQMLLVRPYLVNGTDSLYLQTIAVYGRSRYIQHERGNDKVKPTADIIFRSSNVPESYHYHQMVENETWMDGATLSVVSQLYGCASCPNGEPSLTENNCRMCRFSPGKGTLPSAMVGRIQPSHLENSNATKMPLGFVEHAKHLCLLLTMKFLEISFTWY